MRENILDIRILASDYQYLLDTRIQSVQVIDKSISLVLKLFFIFSRSCKITKYSFFRTVIIPNFRNGHNFSPAGRIIDIQHIRWRERRTHRNNEFFSSWKIDSLSKNFIECKIISINQKTENYWRNKVRISSEEVLNWWERN